MASIFASDLHLFACVGGRGRGVVSFLVLSSVLDN